jgi:predicted PurR-regulated permease PerM
MDTGMATETDRRPPGHSRAVRWAILLAALAGTLYLCGTMLRPFTNVITWASVMTLAFYPVQRRLLTRTGRPSLSALMSTILVVVMILIPLVSIIALAINEFLALRHYLEQTFTNGLDFKSSEPLHRMADWLLRRLGLDQRRIVDAITQHATELGGVIAGFSLAFATNITGALVSSIFTIFVMFFLFRDGDRIVRRIPDFLPFERPLSEGVLLRVRDVIYACLYGVLVIAAIQGALIGVSFWILGIPSAALWGVVTLFTSVIPMLGAGAVWVPGALYLMLTGQWLKAVLLVVWGGAVISSVDNFLRPRLVGGRIGLSELVIFFSVLGGLQVFGLLGIVLGPVVFATAGALLDVLRGKPSRTPVATPGPGADARG